MATKYWLEPDEVDDPEQRRYLELFHAYRRRKSRTGLLSLLVLVPAGLVLVAEPSPMARNIAIAALVLLGFWDLLFESRRMRAMVREIAAIPNRPNPYVGPAIRPWLKFVAIAFFGWFAITVITVALSG